MTGAQGWNIYTHWPDLVRPHAVSELDEKAVPSCISSFGCFFVLANPVALIDIAYLSQTDLTGPPCAAPGVDEKALPSYLSLSRNFYVSKKSVLFRFFIPVVLLG